MKYSFTIVFQFLLCLVCANVMAQNAANTYIDGGGEYHIQKNDAVHPCISADEYKMIEERCAKNEHLAQKNNATLAKTTATPLNWPLKAKAGFPDCDYYMITNYVDQDLTTGLKDYNCGAVTYDGHRGNDICIWPFAFLKMDNDDVEIIAAAPGTIIDKADGNFDRNCTMNSLPANYVIVQHADGSRAMYWHMKKNSVTTKLVGQTVTTGEFLGHVGSSGSSTAPHLHFEVWSGSTSATRVDVYSGPCNTLNANTWWANQKPYTEPAVIHNSVNTAVPVFPGCPTTETTNEDSCYMSGTAKFLIYLRNETIGKTANMRIVNPDGSTFSSWTHNSTTNYTASYWFWTKNLPTAMGVYKFETVYNNDTCTKVFKINCAALSVLSVDDEKLDIYPNPATNTITITADKLPNGDNAISLTNVTGQQILRENFQVENSKMNKSVSIAHLPNGIYYLQLQCGETRIVKKIFKQDQ